MPFDKVGCVTKHSEAASVNDPLFATATANRSCFRLTFN